MIPGSQEIQDVRATVKAWEMLRLVYNGVLLVPGVLLAVRIVRLGFPGMSLPSSVGELVIQCLLFGGAANVCFCLGPYAEFIVVALGFPLTGRKLRWFLFGIGLLLSLGVVGICWLYVEIMAAVPSMP
ncbi:MAG: hypothetical protein HKN82_17395 [Akkermansiaceae bacterium]|nr:hypothetical protein [Akkermansiaceae bacterium]NNM31307.1 hypothetical protein [Akkermansiaceae bacterium]